MFLDLIFTTQPDAEGLFLEGHLLFWVSCSCDCKPWHTSGLHLALKAGCGRDVLRGEVVPWLGGSGFVGGNCCGGSCIAALVYL